MRGGESLSSIAAQLWTILHFIETARTYKARGATTLREEADLPFRDTLARDIRDVRNIGGSSYNQGLQDVLDYYRKNNPELMKKGQ